MSLKAQTNRSERLLEKKRLQALVLFESKARLEGFSNIAGVDEVGRGPLAGPVVAAACIIAEGVFFEGIDDSKKLTPLKRKSLYEQLKKHPKVCFGVGIVSHTVIDQVNIYQASMLAMKEALDQLPLRPDYLLVDGLKLDYANIPSEKLIGGDGRSQSIAAASIIAKEIRDSLMIDYHNEYPLYSFNENKGYATEFHRLALKEHGPCLIHRRSFEPVRLAFDRQNCDKPTPLQDGSSAQPLLFTLPPHGENI